VVKIVPLPAGVGVIAENLPAARKAKEALKVTWSKATAQTYNNEAILRDYQTLAAGEMLSKGDIGAAFNGAAKILKADYFSEHVSHVCMEPLNAKIKKDIVSGGGGDMTYAMPNHLVEWVRDPRGVDVGAWRGIAAGYTKFAIETLVDEIAALKGMDPVAYRLAMLKDSPRAAAVVQAVADMADINRKRPGRAVGIAYNDALHSHTAGAAEVSVDDGTGKIMVHHLWAAVDAGIAVQPKNIVAQIESAMTFGLGAALIEQITVKDGVVQETNFHQYQVVRMSDMPPMDVRVISTDNPPSGIGEAGVPVVAPAIANAVAQLTGKRLRHLPMTPDRVKRGLA
jgi:isoquinoline 1-oxidoreductase subunit beta